MAQDVPHRFADSCGRVLCEDKGLELKFKLRQTGIWVVRRAGDLGAWFPGPMARGYIGVIYGLYGVV